MTKFSVQELLQSDIRLPSPPAIALQIVDLIKREDFSFKELATIIESDPALVTRILCLANSGFYGPTQPVTRIDKAIAMLGMNCVRNIALSFVLSESFRGQRGTRFDFDHFGRRSITAAVASLLLSREINFQCDETFITSLLQDIGVAAMFLSSKDQYVGVLDERLVSHRPLSVLEAETFGYDHQEVGAELLKMWGLPESIYLPIRYHHAGENAPAGIAKLCSVIRAADRLAAIYCGSNTVESAYESRALLSTKFGLSQDRCTHLIDSVAEKSRDLVTQFDIAPGRLRPLSEILQLANRELAHLNLSYEMILLAHKEAKENAERLAKDLKAANRRLRELAFRDDLTGLYNQRYFNTALQREIARCQRYKRPVALILFDIDNFKKINDRYGHPAGDLVLQTIGNEVQRNTRSVDIVIRYAGDEFALLLPETGMAGALVKAESCRAGLAALPVRIKGDTVQVTISAGVASYVPGDANEKSNLFEAADLALYESKQKGRNCVTASRD